MSLIAAIKPLNAFPPEGVVQLDEAESDGALEVVSHVHLPVPPDTLHAVPSKVRHPMHAKLCKGQQKLMSIPIRVIFDQPEENLRARYEAWIDVHESGPVCIGNGEKAVLTNPTDGTKSARVCKGPRMCPLVSVHGFACSFQMRMDVTIEGQHFELRSAAENAYVAMLTTLVSARHMHGPLSKQVFEVSTWAKSTRGSQYEPFNLLTIKHTALLEDAPEADKTSAALAGLAQEIKANWNAQFDLHASDALPMDDSMPFTFSAKPSPKKKGVVVEASKTDPVQAVIDCIAISAKQAAAAGGNQCQTE